MKEEEKALNNLYPEVMLLRFKDEEGGLSPTQYWISKAW